MDEQEALENEIREKWESFRPSYDNWARENGEPLFDEFVDGQVRFARVTYQKDRVYEEQKDNSVTWDRVTSKDCVALQELLDSEPKEPDLHRFLEAHPQFLVQTLGGGHGRFQLSKPRFGAELVPDFAIAEVSSIGVEWHLVEIEPSTHPVERKDGLPTQQLNHAIGQIRAWRNWLRSNLDYARRFEDQNGLGLVGIDERATGLILIGRRQAYSPRYNAFRRDMISSERIVIHSYDWLLDIARRNRSGSLDVELRGPNAFRNFLSS